MWHKGILRECGLEDMSRLFLDILHEPVEPCVLQSGMETFAASKAHKKVLVPEFSLK